MTIVEHVERKTVSTLDLILVDFVSRLARVGLYQLLLRIYLIMFELADVQEVLFLFSTNTSACFFFKCRHKIEWLPDTLGQSIITYKKKNPII